MKDVLISGGAGFVGHHIVEHILKNTNWNVTIIDKLTYSSFGYDRLRDIEVFDNKRVRTFSSSIEIPFSKGLIKEIGKVDIIIHLAAESHVDKSIADPEPFLKSNIIGTYNILEFARKCSNLENMIMFSTDEVYGPAKEGIFFKESDRHFPNNPYSATKSSAEQLCTAWSNTYGVPVFITNTMNVYGERQHPEKFIPLCVNKILSGEKVYIHGSPDKMVSGSRFYIHGRNVADGVIFLLNLHPAKASAWNIVGEKEITNLNLARMIANILGKELKYEIVDFHSSRPGHDLRYALDGSKMRDAGWMPPINFENSLEKTIQWMISPEHDKWMHF